MRVYAQVRIDTSVCVSCKHNGSVKARSGYDRRTARVERHSESGVEVVTFFSGCGDLCRDGLGKKRRDESCGFVERII